MGLPQINIIFKSKAQTAIQRSGRGIVACILTDDTPGGTELQVYNGGLRDVDFTQYTERNYEYLKLIYEGNPSRVIVLRAGIEETGLTAALKVLNNLKWNYLTIPALSTEAAPMVASWIKDAREKDNKTFKAVLPSCTADHEGIINFTTDNITSTLGKEPFHTAEYCGRIAGALAGLSLDRSSTYYQLADITEADTPDDPDERIDKGELVIVFDGAKFKTGRGVTSLTTFTTEKPEDFSKIKIMEGVDLYKDDIRSTFEEAYIGQVINDYDNKQAFVAAVRTYQKGIEGNVLDASYDNTAAVDLDAQRAYLESRSVDVSEMDDAAIAKANTGARVFISSNVKFVDAMEDLDLAANM